jgi:hypothetical protein
MTANQRERIANAMETYQLYLDTNIPTFTSSQYQIVKKVKQELGMNTLMCLNCKSQFKDFYQDIYELYNL